MASRQLSSHLLRLSHPSIISTSSSSTARSTITRLYTPASSLTTPTTHQQTRALHAPYKDSQERDSLKPRKNEGTATGSDDEVAQMQESWDASKTRPEEELQESRGAEGWSMLDESGGNQEFSKPQGDSPSENRGAEGGGGKKNKSGLAKSKKHGLLKPKA